MIKYLKLILIFAIMAGGIFVILNIPDIEEKKEDFIGMDKINVTEKCNEIRDKIGGMQSWDDNIYISLNNDIEQDRKSRFYSQQGYNTVKNTLRENSISKACEFYNIELAKKDGFSHGNLVKAYEGFTLMLTHENDYENDPKAQHVQTLHGLYSAINMFIKSPHAITTHYDTIQNTWETFTAKQNRVLNTARNYRTNALYSEMKHIKGFEDGLNEDMLISQTNKHKGSYYKDLSTQLIKAFNNFELTEANREKVNRAFNKFCDQPGSSDYQSYVSDARADFLRRYKQENG